jgi:predicted AlkP superfamily pyrophosphatase or phosphodiesterase
MRHTCLAVTALALLGCEANKAPKPPEATNQAPAASTPAASGLASASAAPDAAAGPPKDRVILLSIDALRADYLHKPDQFGLKIPTLRKLVERGAHAQALVSVWPTVTYPAHATMVTGVPPAAHGIITNAPYDPKGLKDDAWHWNADEIHSRTLWDAAMDKGLTVGNVYWPSTVGAKITYSFPQIWKAKNKLDDELLLSVGTPGLGQEMLAAMNSLPSEHRDDVARGDGAVFLLERKNPDFLLVYLTDFDTQQHSFGPAAKEAVKVLEVIDAQVARILAATHDEAMDHTTLFVVSDHGFSPIDKAVRPGVLLRRAGLVETDSHEKVVTYRAAMHGAGGMCAINIDDTLDTKTHKTVLGILQRAVKDPKSGIARFFTREQMRGKEGFPNAAFVIEAANGFKCAGGYAGDPVVSWPERGAHGYAPDRPEMFATFLAAGRGIRKGVKLGQVQMVDVAPTVAAALHIPFDSAKGHVITDAFTGPR